MIAYKEKMKEVARTLLVKYATDTEMTVEISSIIPVLMRNIGYKRMDDEEMTQYIMMISDTLRTNFGCHPLKDMMIGLQLGSMGKMGGLHSLIAYNITEWLEAYLIYGERQEARLETPPKDPRTVVSQFRRIPDKEYLQLVFENVRCGMPLSFLNYKDIYNLLLHHGYLRSHLKDASLESLIAKFSTRADPEWEKERKQREAVISEIERCFLDRVHDEKLSFLVDDKDDGRA